MELYGHLKMKTKNFDNECFYSYSNYKYKNKINPKYIFKYNPFFGDDMNNEKNTKQRIEKCKYKICDNNGDHENQEQDKYFNFNDIIILSPAHKYLVYISNKQLFSTKIYVLLDIINTPKIAVSAAPKYTYSYDFDSNGLLHAIGTNFGKEAYKNPVTNGRIEIFTSKMKSDSVPSCNFIGRENSRCLTFNSSPSYFYIYLKKCKLKPTHYLLKNYSASNKYYIKSWNFEGSNDGKTWQTLKIHKKDKSLKGRSKMAKFTLQSSTTNTIKYYSYFRVIMTDKNTGGGWNLLCSGTVFL